MELGPIFITKESILEDLEAKFLKPNLDNDFIIKSQKYIPKESNPLEHLYLLPSQFRMEYQMTRDPVSGLLNMDEYEQVLDLEDEMNAKNSTSMKRDPAPLTHLVRGHANHSPFAPGGMTFTSENHNDLEDLSFGNFTLFEMFKKQDQILTIAPGLDRGLHFDGKKH